MHLVPWSSYDLKTCFSLGFNADSPDPGFVLDGIQTCM